MKKILTAVSLISLAAVCSFAADVKAELQEQISKTFATSAPAITNQGASAQNLSVFFKIYKGHLGRDYYSDGHAEDVVLVSDNSISVNCKAYALDEHTLVLAAPCAKAMAFDGFERGEDEDPIIYSAWLCSTVNCKVRENSQFLGYISEYGIMKDSGESFAYNDRIMVIWNTLLPLSGPYTNVLGVSSPQQLFALTSNHTVKINTSRFGKDAVKDRTLKANSVHKNSFQLDESGTDLSGMSTDPLFLVNTSHSEFLAGYNAAKLKRVSGLFSPMYSDTEGQKSNLWYGLTKADIELIGNSIQKYAPKSWAAVSGRLFYNQTDKPYFKVNK